MGVKVYLDWRQDDDREGLAVIKTPSSEYRVWLASAGQATTVKRVLEDVLEEGRQLGRREIITKMRFALEEAVRDSSD